MSFEDQIVSAHSTRNMKKGWQTIVISATSARSNHQCIVASRGLVLTSRLSEVAEHIGAAVVFAYETQILLNSSIK